ncbi:hypothetical protein AMJ44_14565 [candidate division WOR-1 bacterium DG_54_3]|uniref:Uncharacterized protein n=1 Tax=candidate division WOR-1 bacterium DG_54_3 TaxID=1703775 RepID=A0A0S7XLE8_UNCSA|nr:MAG: hypothetical protein AMJ44_14565 [candidate division WOR-1 bacterium DG_54_3]
MNIRLHTKKFFGNPLCKSLLLSLLFLVALVWLEIKFNIDKEIIAISITGILGIIGYFITHYLENEQKKKDKKIEFYTKLMSEIRLFIIAADQETKDELREKFEETYYKSWLYMSTKAYKKLVEYFNLYQIWSNDKNTKNQNNLNAKLNEFVQTMREEITIDEKIDFKNIYFLPKKGS